LGGHPHHENGLDVSFRAEPGTIESGVIILRNRCYMRIGQCNEEYAATLSEATDEEELAPGGNSYQEDLSDKSDKKTESGNESDKNDDEDYTYEYESDKDEEKPSTRKKRSTSKKPTAGIFCDSEATVCDSEATEYSPPPPKKRKRKAPAEVDLMEDLSDEEVVYTESKKTKMKQQKRDKVSKLNPVAEGLVKVKRRPAGQRPLDAVEQMDVHVRNKTKICRTYHDTLQAMSTPCTRSDEYDPKKEPELKAQERDENAYPWVIHNMSFVTEQKSNPDGNGKAGRLFLPVPELHFYCGSKKAAEKLESMFGTDNQFKLVVHYTFESYHDALRSDSAINKPPPPRR